jgi:hypothetical protein
MIVQTEQLDKDHEVLAHFLEKGQVASVAAPSENAEGKQQKSITSSISFLYYIYNCRVLVVRHSACMSGTVNNENKRRVCVRCMCESVSACRGDASSWDNGDGSLPCSKILVPKCVGGS